MPTYLCHGFRWHRKKIRPYVAIHDLVDVAPDWVAGRTSSSALLSHWHATLDFLPKTSELAMPSFPVQTRLPEDPADRSHLPHQEDDFSLPPPRGSQSHDNVLGEGGGAAVRLLEEYDPLEMESASRPYAYVADYAIRIDLSADLAEEVARYDGRLAGRDMDQDWFGALRDELQSGEPIRWYVVVCGDEERAVLSYDEEESEERERTEEDDDDGYSTERDPGTDAKMIIGEAI